MSDEKKNLINEEELSKVAGGSASFRLDTPSPEDAHAVKLANIDETQESFSAPRARAL